MKNARNTLPILTVLMVAVAVWSVLSTRSQAILYPVTDTVPQAITQELNRYVYPSHDAFDHWDDLSLNQKIELRRIPAEVLADMSDLELVQAMIDYPFISDVNTLAVHPDRLPEETREWLRESIRERCSAYDELMRRGTFDQAFKRALINSNVVLHAPSFSDSPHEVDTFTLSAVIEVFSDPSDRATNLHNLMQRARLREDGHPQTHMLRHTSGPRPMMM